MQPQRAHTPNPLKGAYFSTAKGTKGAKVSLRSSHSLRLDQTTAKGAKGRKGSSPSASFALFAVKQNNRKGRKGRKGFFLCVLRALCG